MYEAPQVDFIEVEVEKGFAVSYGSNSPENTIPEQGA